MFKTRQTHTAKPVVLSYPATTGLNAEGDLRLMFFMLTRFLRASTMEFKYSP